MGIDPSRAFGRISAAHTNAGSRLPTLVGGQSTATRRGNSVAGENSQSFQLELSMVRYIAPIQLSQLAYTGLEWIWFAGCDPLSHQAQKQLHSPRLSDIDGNTQYRRALWQQICAHQGIAS